MTFKFVFAAAGALMTSSAIAGAVVFPVPGQLGSLSVTPALYADMGFVGHSFADEFSFELLSKSDVFGSVGQMFGTVTFTAVLIDNIAMPLLAQPTGFGFSFAGLDTGLHVLKVEGSFPNGNNAFIGSIYATPSKITTPVPEPESLALALAGLGLIAGAAARLRRAA